VRPWFSRYPDLFQREVAELGAAYPELRLCSSAIRAGRVEFHGVLSFATETGARSSALLVRYPEGFPYLPPEVFPLEADPGDEPHEGAALSPRFFSARHQMAGGSICLFELPTSTGPARVVLGTDAVRRAERWLRYAMRGRFPPDLDSLEADIQAHYERSGNIVVGPIAYRPDIKIGGRFIVRRVREGPSPLYALTHIETTQGWVDERELLSTVGWPELPKSPGEWDVVVTAEGLARASVSNDWIVGTWFNAAREIRPVRTLGDLAEQLFGKPAAEAVVDLQRHFAAELAKDSRVVVGINFPGRVQPDREWLFFDVAVRDEPRPVVKVGEFEAPLLDFSAETRAAAITKTRLRVFRCHDLRRSRMELRVRSEVPAEVGAFDLSVLGVGALGSQIAELLCKSGVGQIRIWDPGDLDAGNVIRHTADLFGIGFPKAVLVSRRLQTINPHCRVSIGGAAALQRDSAPPWPSTAAVSSIADDAQELAVNSVAVRAQATVYYARTLRRGSVARLIRVRPFSDACLECLALHIRDGRPEAMAVAAAPGEEVGRECGQAVLAASAADLAVAAGACTRLILQDLADPGAENHWVWTTAGVPGLAGLEKPFSARATRLEPHPECAACSSKPVARVVLSVDLRVEMERLAREAAPRETGGILVGRRQGADGVVIAASGPGPNAKATEQLFERDGPFCQEFLERVAAGADVPVDYAGEWHSHPASDATPSPRDIKSLEDTARDPDYLTESPVMVIVAFPGGAGAPPQYSSTCYPEYGAGYRIPLEPP
jgi:integrative and conjugative element protein (TIGR02256 family)